MKRRDLYRFGLLISGGLIARLLVFMNVGINNDTGLYLYDAKQLLWGRHIFIDFPSRSPVFEYALAGVLSFGYSPIVSARVLMLTISMFLGIVVYLFARQIHSHESGLVAMALFYLTPFSVVWGLWVKTEQMAALFAIIAFIIAFHVIDREKIPSWSAVVIGASFALSFLVRQAVIVHMGVFVMFAIYYRARYIEDVKRTVIAGLTSTASFFSVLLTVYYIVSDFNLGITREVFAWHFVGLFISNGRGNFGWLNFPVTASIISEKQSLFAMPICSGCASTFMLTILATLPVILILLIFLRSYLGDLGVISNTIVPASFVLLGLTGLILLVRTAHLDRLLAAGIFINAVILVWGLDAIPFERIWSPKMALPVSVLVALTVSYIMRGQTLHVTYFQDFYPYIVILAGISAVEFLRMDFGHDRRRVIIGTASTLLVLSMLVAGANAYVYQPGDDRSDMSWFSIELVQEYGDDIESRTDDNARILTAQPLYVIEADRQIANNLSRKYYLFRNWPESEATARQEAILLQTVKDESVTHVIHDKELEEILDESERLKEEINCRFTPADDQRIYEYSDATLLERKDESNCP